MRSVRNIPSRKKNREPTNLRAAHDGRRAKSSVRSFSAVFVGQPCKPQVLPKPQTAVDPHVGIPFGIPPQDDIIETDTEKEGRGRREDDEIKTVIPKIRPLSMDCHSERNAEERGNQPLFLLCFWLDPKAAKDQARRKTAGAAASAR